MVCELWIASGHTDRFSTMDGPLEGPLESSESGVANSGLYHLAAQKRQETLALDASPTCIAARFWRRDWHQPLPAKGTTRFVN